VFVFDGDDDDDDPSWSWIYHSVSPVYNVIIKIRGYNPFFLLLLVVKVSVCFWWGKNKEREEMPINNWQQHTYTHTLRQMILHMKRTLMKGWMMQHLFSISQSIYPWENDAPSLIIWWLTHPFFLPFFSFDTYKFYFQLPIMIMTIADNGISKEKKTKKKTFDDDSYKYTKSSRLRLFKKIEKILICFPRYIYC